MKKLISIIFLIIGVLIFATACKSAVAKPVYIYTKEIDSTYTSEKLQEQQSISQAIFDSMFIKIQEVEIANVECDSLCQRQMDFLLNQFNFYKTSGDNSYSILYNKYKKQLEFTAKMKETKTTNSNKENIQYRDKIKYIEKPVEVPVYTNILTKLQKWLIGFGIAFLVYIGYKIFRIIKLNFI